MGLAPMFKPASPAQALFASVPFFTCFTGGSTRQAGGTSSTIGSRENHTYQPVHQLQFVKADDRAKRNAQEPRIA
jgi:hypothetical protein